MTLEQFMRTQKVRKRAMNGKFASFNLRKLALSWIASGLSERELHETLADIYLCQ